MGKCYKKDIIKLAKKQVGVAEKPVNRVKYNTWYYGREVSGDAYPWCMAFQSWLFAQFDALDLIGGKSASCAQTVAWFKKVGQWHSTPKVGDLVFFTFSHVELVIDVHNGYVITIGGNTSPDTSVDKSIEAQRNGGGVYKRKRYSSILGYGRPNYASKYDKVDVTVNGNIYRKPSVIYKTLGKVKVDNKVDFIKDLGKGWSKVKFGKVKGYIKNTCLGKKGLSTYPTKTIKTDAPFRNKNKKKAPIEFVVLKNNNVKVVSKGTIWSNIKYTHNGKEVDGFVANKHIE